MTKMMFLVVASMIAKIDFFFCTNGKVTTCQTSLLPKCKDKSSERFPNSFSGHQHRTEFTDDGRYGLGLRFDILEFQGNGQLENLSDWVSVVEEVFEYIKSSQ